MRRAFTDAERDRIRTLRAAGGTIPDIAQTVGRTYASVKCFLASERIQKGATWPRPSYEGEVPPEMIEDAREANSRMLLNLRA